MPRPCKSSYAIALPARGRVKTKTGQLDELARANPELELNYALSASLASVTGTASESAAPGTIERCFSAMRADLPVRPRR
jgi:hypothetical protein